MPLGRGVLDALAGAVPAAVGGRQRHEPQAAQAAAGDPPVVRVEPGAQVAVVVLDAREPLDGASQLGPGGRHDLAEERRVVQRHGGVGQARRQPAAVAVPAAVPEEPLPPVHVRVPLEPLEVPAHRLAAPGRVAELVGDRVPVRSRPGDRDHRVVGRAAAQRAGPRIPDAAAVGDELGVAPSALVVGVVAHEVVPAERLVLGRLAVERRHRRVHALVVAARLEQQHAHPGPGEVDGDRAAAGAGAHDHIVELDASAMAAVRSAASARPVRAPC